MLLGHRIPSFYAAAGNASVHNYHNSASRHKRRHEGDSPDSGSGRCLGRGPLLDRTTLRRKSRRFCSAGICSTLSAAILDWQGRSGWVGTGTTRRGGVTHPPLPLCGAKLSRCPLRPASHSHTDDHAGSFVVSCHVSHHQNGETPGSSASPKRVMDTLGPLPSSIPETLLFQALFVTRRRMHWLPHLLLTWNDWCHVPDWKRTAPLTVMILRLSSPISGTYPSQSRFCNALRQWRLRFVTPFTPRSPSILAPSNGSGPVSYTHLTLPTILRVWISVV